MSPESFSQQVQSAGILADKRILVCRPEPAASELTKALSAFGADCLSLPMLQIEAIKISAEERQRIMNLDHYQHVIVISQHAAEFGTEQIDTYWPQAPVEQQWYAIGRKTAASLESTDLSITAPDHDLSSEKLLEHKALQQVKGDKVLILKGLNGRDALEKELTSRGALVESVCLYQRIRPNYSPEHISERVSFFSPDFIIALSGETLVNLIEYCSALDIDLSDRSFILPSSRVANIAYESGIKNSYIPDNLMPIDIIRCIKQAR